MCMHRLCAVPQKPEDVSKSPGASTGNSLTPGPLQEPEVILTTESLLQLLFCLFLRQVLTKYVEQAGCNLMTHTQADPCSSLVLNFRRTGFAGFGGVAQ